MCIQSCQVDFKQLCYRIGTQLKHFFKREQVQIYQWSYGTAAWRNHKVTTNQGFFSCQPRTGALLFYTFWSRHWRRHFSAQIPCTRNCSSWMIKLADCVSAFVAVASAWTQAFSSCLFNPNESVIEYIFSFHTSISRQIRQNSELESELRSPVKQTWHIRRRNASQQMLLLKWNVFGRLKKNQAFAPNTSFPCPQLMINNGVTSSVVMWKGSKCPTLEIKRPILNSLSLCVTRSL